MENLANRVEKLPKMQVHIKIYARILAYMKIKQYLCARIQERINKHKLMTRTQSTHSLTRGGYLRGKEVKDGVTGILRMLAIFFLFVCMEGRAQVRDSVLLRSGRAEDTLLLSVDTLGLDTLVVDTLALDSVALPVEKKPFMALRTNMLYDAVLIPNIGLEVWLGKGFTLGFDWFGSWLYSDKQHVYWQGYGGYLTARYYWGKLAVEQPFHGHHVGIYGTALTYDVEFGGKGYQAAKFGFGGGVEYGYSLPVAKNLCIDFNLGVGYQGGEYKAYLPTDDGTGHYVWLSTHKRRWFGPTKAEISLKWILEARVKKKAPAVEESLPEAEGGEEHAEKQQSQPEEEKKGGER